MKITITKKGKDMSYYYESEAIPNVGDYIALDLKNYYLVKRVIHVIDKEKLKFIIIDVIDVGNIC